VGWAISELESSDILPREATDVEQKIWSGLLGAIESLKFLDVLGRPVSYERFLEVLNEKLENLRLPLSSDNMAGVQVMDVMAARGQTFEGVFLLGLNEKLFPRLIREDPFLSDQARSALSSALGLRLGRKMDGFQEEKLLFELATSSATRHLHLSCQRSDEEGKALVISLYLHDFLKKTGLKLFSVPRYWSERVQGVSTLTLLPKEVSIAFHREGQSPEVLYKGMGWDRALLAHLLQSQKEMESFGVLGPHDGLIGKDHPLSKVILEQGLSPQSLKDLAECPFKVFSRKILELYTSEPDVEDGQITHTGRGKLIHKILEVFYKTNSKLDNLETIADEEFKLYPGVYSELYPLALEAEKAHILDLLKRFIPMDLDDQAASGFKPAYFETPVAGEIQGIKLQGRIDRLDLGPIGFRVVDYKTGSGGIKKNETLETAIMKGKSFQLPVYLALAKTWLDRQSSSLTRPPATLSLQGEGLGVREEGEALFYRLEEEDATEEPFRIGPHFWKDYGDRFYQNLSFLVKNIEYGSFYIRPSDSRGYCEWCQYAAVCRKEHKPTQVRSENSPIRKKHEETFSSNSVVRGK
jgi:ATP-dependent helicase/DNAse subunit B